MKDFYNTNKTMGQELSEVKSTAQKQQQNIIQFFNMNPERAFTPSDIHRKIFTNKTPITSVRRAITNLTDAGRLFKTNLTRRGPYGRKEHLWALTGNTKYNNVTEEKGGDPMAWGDVCKVNFYASAKDRLYRIKNRRDGTITGILKAMSKEMEIPYKTLRRWYYEQEGCLKNETNKSNTTEIPPKINYQPPKSKMGGKREGAGRPKRTEKQAKEILTHCPKCGHEYYLKTE